MSAHRRACAAALAIAVLAGAPIVSAQGQQTLPGVSAEEQAPPKKGSAVPPDTQTEVTQALVRLPLAALLGAGLALRPRRRGTPRRQPAVVQTQIILAIVGAVVMMVVGTNLARAFGVVGAAGLVRYRAKIEDPKDAGVMLSTLAIGLGAGVGLYAMAAVSAAFVLFALWVIESFEPHTRLPFDITIKMGDDTDSRAGDIEAIFRRYRVDFEVRSSSDEELCYDLRVPFETPRQRITRAILRLDPQGHAAVQWAEKKPKTK